MGIPEMITPFLVRATDITARISYKDWRFEVGQDAIDLYWLRVAFQASDNATGADSTWAGRKWRLSRYMTDSEIVQTALKAVLTAEEHEAREKFLYRGLAIFGPHLDVESLHTLLREQGAGARDERAPA